MNAIRAIPPYRHEGLWVFDEGQRSAISGQLSAKTPGGIKGGCFRIILVAWRGQELSFRGAHLIDAAGERDQPVG